MLIWVFTENGKLSKYRCSDVLGSCWLCVQGCSSSLQEGVKALWKKHLKYCGCDLHYRHIAQPLCVVETRWRHGLTGR